MAAQTFMIQGTASHVGKSLLTAALCRIFAQRGIQVAPFKAQNMSNNSFVTPEGHEIGRAQAVQAYASRRSPHVNFNPVLIKPTSDNQAQLVVKGHVAGTLSATDFGRIRREFFPEVCHAFAEVASVVDRVILEGAGSPAEINLREHDIVNMAMARQAQAPVMLVGDIDRGGVFASIVGTMELLTPQERNHVQGFVINKFRGHLELLKPGIRELERRIGIPCLGVLPFISHVNVPEEDSVGWESHENMMSPTQGKESLRPDAVTIGIVDLPYLSNSTDFDALCREPDVQVLRLGKPTSLPLDALIIPGTKNTIDGLRFLNERGLDHYIHHHVETGGVVLGICGGYQMLGHAIHDPLMCESKQIEVQGLGLLDAETWFESEKVTTQASGHHCQGGGSVVGYEVHMGKTQVGQASPMLTLRNADQTGSHDDGAIRSDGRVMGCYLHGLFDSLSFRRWFLNQLRRERGWDSLPARDCGSLDQDLDQVALVVQTHLHISRIEEIMHAGCSSEKVVG